jgi:hypothetical protein
MATPLSARSLSKFKIAWETLGKDRFEELLKKEGYSGVWQIPEEEAENVWRKVFLPLAEVRLAAGLST